MFGSFGMMEILLILIVGVVVFGAIRLPRLARNISSGWHELKRLKRGFDLGLDEHDEQPPRQHTQNYDPAQQQYNQAYYHESPGQRGFEPGKQMNQQGNTDDFHGQQEPPTPQDDGRGPSANSAGMSGKDEKKSG
jgi:TatA/E family protein of Tat protein translocase